MLRPGFISKIEELQSTVSIAGATVSMTLRKYVYDDSVLSKVVFENKVTYTEIKIIIMNVAGSVVGVLYQLYVLCSRTKERSRYCGCMRP